MDNKKDKKILFIIDELGSGGAERVLSELANYFAENGESVYVINLLDKEIFYPLNKKIKHFVFNQGKGKYLVIRYYQRIKYIKYIIRHIKPDIAISFLPMSNMVSCLTFWNEKTPLIISERNDPNRNPESKMMRIIRNQLYRLADGVVFQTKDAQRYFSKDIQKKSVIIFNPLKRGLKAKKGEHKEILFTVGRLEKQKNQEMLIRAFKKVSEVFPEYKLWIFGTGSEENSLKQEAKNLGLSNKITFKGVSAKWHEEVENADIFILPSNYEGMPNSLMEALALGKICISTDCPIGGPRELIRNGENGFLIRTGNQEDLEEKIIYSIKNREKLSALRNQAIEDSKDYQLSIISKKWMDFIESMI